MKRVILSLTPFFLGLLLSVGPCAATQVISFGQVCATALALREKGMREAAYPFDWIISPFEALYAALSDDFAHFLQEDSVYVREDGQGIVDHYGFEFVHDLPTIKTDADEVTGDYRTIQNYVRSDWKEFLPAVREKYARRIARLQQLLSGKEKVIIIRYLGTTKEQALQLRDLLHRKYPRLDFTLVIMGNNTDFRKDWGLSRIKNFYFNDAGKTWNDPLQWGAVFTALGIQR